MGGAFSAHLAQASLVYLGDLVETWHEILRNFPAGLSGRLRLEVSWPEPNPIEPRGHFRSGGIAEVEQTVVQGVGVQRRPMDQVGRAFDHHHLAIHAADVDAKPV